ncbi:DNA polymerase III subunit delta [Lentilactobacillus sp. Marseille-Q4993]|uniref:DNA polymerase III subunit delta n=1 Tax=Lentilactobacillus sp. Marseille-Q4993 TaxID=3039492 RepID=UPI0024BC4265|nr:DNA polymerase III subunit delta [Lentilactobacillus sp. Marseille-Q4993]
MNYTQLLNNLKNNKYKQLYVVKGAQEYLSDQIKQAFVNLIPDEERDMNVSNFDMEETPISVAVEDAVSIPFFGEKRLVFINRPFFLTGSKSKSKVNHNLDDLLAYLEHPEESSVVVFFAPYEKLDARKKVTKLLTKQAEVIDISKISESEIKTLVADKLNASEMTIDQDALEKLLELTAGNLTKIMAELPKLMLYNQQSKVIDVESVTGLVTRSMEQNVFDLVNSVLLRRANESLDIYHQLLLENEEPLRINAVLVQQFRLMIQVNILQKHGYAQGNIASALKVHPFRVKLAMQSVRKYHYDELRDAYLGLIDIERKLKSTSQTPELLFELFIVEFMKKRSA